MPRNESSPPHPPLNIELNKFSSEYNNLLSLIINFNAYLLSAKLQPQVINPCRNKDKSFIIISRWKIFKCCKELFFCRRSIHEYFSSIRFPTLNTGMLLFHAFK